MADTRIIPSSLPTPTAVSGAPARTEAAVAAQRAFFQAALTGREIAAPAPPVRSEAKAAATSSKLSARASDLPPDRILRPGSLLDIKV
jgi:hypothetical protein